ncbi:hypothetical protein C8R45DRAFT_1042060, partial [Mycena sanguinolenta]
EGVEELHERSLPAIYAVAFPDRDSEVSDDDLGFAHAPSSLDGSIPSSTDVKIVVDASQLPVFGTIDKEEWDEISAKQKRKAEGGTPPSQDRGRKRICQRNDSSRWKTIYRRGMHGLTEAEVIGQFAGVRLAILETGRRMEDIVWSLYGVDQSAKMQIVWYVLQHHGRTQMANTLHELLSIRLRLGMEETRCVDAALLDYRYPEYVYNYYDILRRPGDPPPMRRDDDEESDISSSGTSDDDKDLPMLQYPEIYVCPLHASSTPSTRTIRCYDDRGRILVAPNPGICYDEFGDPRPTAVAIARARLVMH